MLQNTLYMIALIFKIFTEIECLATNDKIGKITLSHLKLYILGVVLFKLN
jgi:hypothetical protein